MSGISHQCSGSRLKSLKGVNEILHINAMRDMVDWPSKTVVSSFIILVICQLIADFVPAP